MKQNCQTEVTACWGDTSPAGCDCQDLEDCLFACNGKPNKDTCETDCKAAHPTGQAASDAWRACASQKCGADAGGACPL